MILDVTGIELWPGMKGINCPGNGEYVDENGNKIECCCDACDYIMCCLETHPSEECKTCTDAQCPNTIKQE